MARKQSKLIEHFPQPLLGELVQDRWLPIVGAGMSLNAIVPPGMKMPLWDQLGRALARDIGDYEYSGTVDAISAYAHNFSRTKLVERVSDLLLIDKARPGGVHRAFCSIKFPIVCTTNFDFLLERQYDANPLYCRPVISEDQLSIPNREPGVTLLKLHGDVHHPDRLVATEEDYDGFLQRYPLIATYLANLLITKSAVFIGYSLEDPDFRQIFQLIKDRLGKMRRPAYAIKVAASAQEIARYRRRGVEVINLPGRASKYGEVLTVVFEELREYQEREKIPGSQVTDEDALRELSLPPGTPNRLCYCSVPFSLASIYKESVFPIIRRSGFVPITADEVVSPGESIAAKVDAVLSRANIALIDATTPATQVELGLAWSKLGPDHILVIVDEDRPLAPENVRFQAVLIRPNPPFGDADPFLQRIAEWFSARADAIRPRLAQEPQQLLQMGVLQGGCDYSNHVA